MNNPRTNGPRRGGFALALLVFFVIASAPAGGHPLGNFTVNHFARLDIDATRVRVHFVVDMAEIPTFQESLSLDADGDGKVTQAELDAYAARAARASMDGLLLT